MDAVSTQNLALGQPNQPPQSSAEPASTQQREVRDARSAPQPPETQTQQESLPETQAQRDSLVRQPILAVRSGPAPADNLRVDMEEVLRQTLTEHSTIRRVGEVLSIETPTQEPEVELRLPGTGSELSEAELRLPGGREAPSAETAPVAPGRMVSTASLNAQGGQEAREELKATQREERENELEPSRRQENEVGSSSVASHTGGVQNPDDPRRVELPGDPSQPEGTAVAEAAFTQAGLVEATSEDQIVTRFFEGTPPGDSGAEPQPQENLGERSVPFSTYA